MFRGAVIIAGILCRPLARRKQDDPLKSPRLAEDVKNQYTE